jgi:hypothetical protein
VCCNWSQIRPKTPNGFEFTSGGGGTSFDLVWVGSSSQTHVRLRLWFLVDPVSKLTVYFDPACGTLCNELILIPCLAHKTLDANGYTAIAIKRASYEQRLQTLAMRHPQCTLALKLTFRFFPFQLRRFPVRLLSVLGNVKLR